ncbi:hypothetical protein, partial [Flavobacterium longum]|uniref:hypothetical protein n=1 Tax=Flavobacterium longum TaxID=1299340 RepID=UPI0039EA3A94
MKKVWELRLVAGLWSLSFDIRSFFFQRSGLASVVVSGSKFEVQSWRSSFDVRRLTSFFFQQSGLASFVVPGSKFEVQSWRSSFDIRRLSSFSKAVLL